MTNLILPVKIAPITPELLERFKASGEWILGATFAYMIEHPETKKRMTTMMPIYVKWQEVDGFGDLNLSGFYSSNNTLHDEMNHYLPDGLPDPSAAVEVFETQIERFYLSGNNDYELGIGYPSEVIPPEGTKVGVFKL
jgi:hypothetical protein